MLPGVLAVAAVPAAGGCVADLAGRVAGFAGPAGLVLLGLPLCFLGFLSFLGFWEERRISA